VDLNTIIPNCPFPYNLKPATWVNDIKMIATLALYIEILNQEKMN
jgi:hypothetical protein